jgi:hypothetical protein
MRNIDCISGGGVVGDRRYFSDLSSEAVFSPQWKGELENNLGLVAVCLARHHRDRCDLSLAPHVAVDAGII